MKLLTQTEKRVRLFIYADEIDTKAEAENRLDYDGGLFSYSHYDITAHHDKAIFTLHKETDGDVYNASIWGRPIVFDLTLTVIVLSAIWTAYLPMVRRR